LRDAQSALKSDGAETSASRFDQDESAVEGEEPARSSAPQAAAPAETVLDREQHR